MAKANSKNSTRKAGAVQLPVVKKAVDYTPQLNAIRRFNSLTPFEKEKALWCRKNIKDRRKYIHSWNDDENATLYVFPNLIVEVFNNESNQRIIRPLKSFNPYCFPYNEIASNLATAFQEINYGVESLFRKQHLYICN